MNFGILMSANFANPISSYEFTRENFVRTINQYVEGSFEKNLSVSQFGLNGKIAFPPADPILYMTPPSPSIMSGCVVSYVAGEATEDDYDVIAQQSRAEIGSFWPNFFELIGKVFLRSKYTVTPITYYSKWPIVQYSTPLEVTPEYLESTESYYLTTRNKYSQKKILQDWRRAGEAFSSEVLALKLNDQEKLMSMLGLNVKETAERTSSLFIQYAGSMKLASYDKPCVYEGLIYGKMKFD